MNFSCLTGNNLNFLEELYQHYLHNPNSVDKSWADLFSALEHDSSSSFAVTTNNTTPSPNSQEQTLKMEIIDLIHKYRAEGHKMANLNPLEQKVGGLEHNIANLSERVILNGALKLNESSVAQVIEILKNTYCQTIGLEFSHIKNQEEREWLQSKFENYNWRASLSKEQKQKIFADVMEAELFENYLHVKFPGAKRFSVEGGESSIVSLEAIIEASSNLGAEEIAIGMAHRGRLNTLTKVLKKRYAAMLYEFQGNVSLPDEYQVSGDVKYHMGASCNRVLNNGRKIHLSLAANPSHLEAVNPILMGKVRCKQDRLANRDKVLGILIHGDAAFTGQGIVHECFNLNSVSNNYGTGGLIHIIVNNQVGFTTNPKDGRGYQHPSYPAVGYELPIFHVNGDDPEAATYASIVATEYRYKFNKDIIINIECYRRYGHNEGDEPKFTQPRMYTVISAHKTLMNIYGGRLLSEGVLNQTELESMKAKFKEYLEEEFKEAKNYKPEPGKYYNDLWQSYKKPPTGTKFAQVKGISIKKIKELANKLCSIPNNININTKVEKLLLSRLEAIEKDSGIDWGNAEHLAFASLLADGVNIRLAGQDCERGTFSHRHAVIVDQISEEKYLPLQNISNNQGEFNVINSTLSEYAAMGFEYGYSLVTPNNLVLWEAQFGDFANGAQIIIDQFIAAGETKWLQSSGLVLLLPHGYEGQGPEHSSARMERFLQLCAEDNMQIVNCSTPSNYFHILRRQHYNKFRKPLVIFTPKSLLRHKSAVSSVVDLSDSSYFQPVISDPRTNLDSKKMVLCTGKVYYDIINHIKDKKDIAVVRLEQLHPFPAEEVKSELKKYKPKEIIWCQEEPKNMGGWFFVREMFSSILNQDIKYIGRKASASTASGYLSVHNAEQQEFLDNLV